MDRIGIVGTTWRTGGVDRLPDFTIPADGRPARLPEIASRIGATELVYLATCNRVEVTYVGDGVTSAETYRRRIFEALTGSAPRRGEAERVLRAWAGEGAAEHLFLVAAGLDSAKLGETDIVAQVRDAVDTARRLGLMGPRLSGVFHGALKVARRVHNLTGVGRGHVSLANVALEHLRARVRAHPGVVALVGVSPMTRACARELSRDGARVLIVNRTEARARELALQIGAESASLADFKAHPDPIVALMTSTGSPDAVFTEEDLRRIVAQNGDAPLIVDMAVPADVRPEAAAAAGVTRVGMDQLVEEASANRERRLEEFADARTVVDDALLELRRRMAERVVGPMMIELRRRYRNAAAEHVERFMRRDMPDLDEAERVTVRRWADALARHLAHVPLVGLRNLAVEHGPGLVDEFFAGANERLARELREVAERAGQPAFEDAEGL
ncbi:MAG: glutamyl-tRNA reductase [Planctomycetota bacterium]|jgi:glutamyl-tRNA reductase